MPSHTGPAEDNPLTEDVLADGATSAERGPPDSYMTTDGSATTATTDSATPPVGAPVERAAAEQEEKYLRLAAEYDNFRKRSRRENDQAGARAQAELAKALIDGLDDLSRFAHLDPAATDPATIVQGALLVERKLLKSLSAAGLEVIDPTGKPFDPAVAEAVSTEPATTADEDHIVARVYQVGYVFKGQLLRPARVVVKQFGG